MRATATNRSVSKKRLKKCVASGLKKVIAFKITYNSISRLKTDVIIFY